MFAQHHTDLSNPPQRIDDPRESAERRERELQGDATV
jgi:hypothetical protein